MERSRLIAGSRRLKIGLKWGLDWVRINRCGMESCRKINRCSTCASHPTPPPFDELKSEDEWKVRRPHFSSLNPHLKKCGKRSAGVKQYRIFRPLKEQRIRVLFNDWFAVKICEVCLHRQEMYAKLCGPREVEVPVEEE